MHKSLVMLSAHNNNSPETGSTRNLATAEIQTVNINLNVISVELEICGLNAQIEGTFRNSYTALQKYIWKKM